MQYRCLIAMTASLAVLSGCASRTEYTGPPITLVEAPRVEPVAEDGDLGDAVGADPADTAPEDLGEVPALRSIAEHLDDAPAADRSMVQSAAAERIRSLVHFRYLPGTVYQIDTQPGFLTALVLEKGEHVVARAAGDTERWLVEETSVGEGQWQQVTLLIKPTTAPLVTNLLVTTNRRLYQIELLAHQATDASYQSLVAWKYAGPMVTAGADWDGARAGRGADAATAPPAADIAVGVATDLSELDFEYRVRPAARRAPRWTPQQVFHDGAKTYIKFPPHVMQTEAPPLFVRNGKEDQLVNYRVVGDTYVVDRVVDLAVLKIGKVKADQVVIEYAGDYFGEL